MLTINPSALRAPLPEMAAAPAPAGHESTDAAGFSSLLRQSQVAAAPKVNPPAPTPHQDKADQAPEAQAPTEPNDTEAATAPEVALPAHAAPKPKLRAGDAPLHATKPGGAAQVGEAKPAEPVAAAPEHTTPTTTAPLDPNIAQWLAAQQRPVGAAKAANAAPSTDATASAPVVADVSAKSARPEGTTLATDAKDKTGHVASRFAAAAEAAGLSAAAPAARAAESAPIANGHAAAAAGDVLASASLQAPQTLRENAAPAAVVVIATPVNAPEFAQTLGVQLSVLAKDGIQQAELHLNPAEMGPVSVQIVMEGTQARIDFGADVAATRHAIEAGLPELASALRDAGFTLAGGGVSQHSGQRGEGRQADGGSPQRGQRKAASDEAVARVATAARRIVTQGGVDLYA